MADEVTWSDIFALMRREPRPSFRAVVIERTPEYEGLSAVDRRITVLHDGDALWFIQENQEMRLGTATEAVLYENESVEAIRGMYTSFDNGIKALFHGRLMSALPDATGSIVGTKAVAGRQCWLVDVHGSGARAGDREVPVLMAIDQATGFVLEITRPDHPLAFILVESIDIGEATLPPPEDPAWHPRGPEDFPEMPRPPAPGEPRPIAISPDMTDEELRRTLFGN